MMEAPVKDNIVALDLRSPPGTRNTSAPAAKPRG
jgi:hypothetical protein